LFPGLFFFSCSPCFLCFFRLFSDFSGFTRFISCAVFVLTSAFSNTIKERLTQGGASGAFFFFSKGEKFIAKSCTMEELETLKLNAKAYADYMVTHRNSYISKVSSPTSDVVSCCSYSSFFLLFFLHFSVSSFFSSPSSTNHLLLIDLWNLSIKDLWQFLIFLCHE
jgi:hypothetical protein